ncbi:TPA: hypothetical protein RI751_003625 [Vibrio cholerae]|nr:hypothetical protein [Vibrio cholerae]MVB33558.1 hypothetical protein [Vibrio cholerae]MVB44754.1 hypothetical protein [Vibrio cholerae]MVB52347.1 hypothetical protein [Vibrio cholerae]MVB59642.1 hypothetical protein [Vibrio cholerae]
MTYQYVTFNGSSVFVSNEDSLLKKAQAKLMEKFPNAVVSTKEVPDHHLTSAFRLRLVPEVSDLLKAI